MQSYFHVIKANLISVTWKGLKKKDTALKYLIAQFINKRKINRLLHTNMTYSDYNGPRYFINTGISFGCCSVQTSG